MCVTTLVCAAGAAAGVEIYAFTLSPNAATYRGDLARGVRYTWEQAQQFFPGHSGGYEPPPMPPTEGFNTGPALRRGSNVLVFPWDDPLACSTPEGFDWLPPAEGPFISGPWEQPIQLPPALAIASISYNPLDKTYGGEGRATGAKATLVKSLQSGPKFLGAKMKYSSFRFDQNKHDRSHLIPKEFGGRGLRENIVPLYKWINEETKTLVGPLRKIEKAVKAAVEAGVVVEYEVIPIYNDGNTTQFPDAIHVTATGQGININETIDNIPSP